MKNIVYIVLKNDVSNSDVPIVSVFDTIDKSQKFILNDIDNILNYNNFISDDIIKEWKAIQIQKYKKFLEKYDLLYYYGEYKNYYDISEPYQIKYKIEKHKIN